MRQPLRHIPIRHKRDLNPYPKRDNLGWCLITLLWQYGRDRIWTDIGAFQTSSATNLHHLPMVSGVGTAPTLKLGYSQPRTLCRPRRVNFIFKYYASTIWFFTVVTKMWPFFSGDIWKLTSMTSSIISIFTWSSIWFMHIPICHFTSPDGRYRIWTCTILLVRETF